MSFFNGLDNKLMNENQIKGITKLSELSGKVSSAAVQPILRIKKVLPNAKLPTKAHEGDLGYDLYAAEKTILLPNAVTKVRTGIACGFPAGFGGIIKDRSSVALKLEVFTKGGVIDSGYQNEILILFYNPNQTKPCVFEVGEKIAQLVLTKVHSFPVLVVDELTSESSRGMDGFGSTGKF
jgi:deoxyuridine 5'-triphosphate nucleotidohydrolase